MRTIKLFLSAAAIVSLPACAPTVWDRPGATPAEFSMDVAQCTLLADYPSRQSEGNPPADVKQQTPATGAQRRCMEAKGYVASVTGAPRGSRTLTFRPADGGTPVASANIEYLRGASGADLLRFQPKFALSHDRLDGSHALADIGGDAPWQKWLSRSWWF